MPSHRATRRPSRRTDNNWFARVVRSSSFAWLLSIAVHATVFAILWGVAFRTGEANQRVIVPEARLAPPGQQRENPPPKPLDLVEQDQPQTPSDIEMPDVEIPAISLPQEDSPTISLPGETSSIDRETFTTPGTMTPAQGPMSQFFGQSGNAYRVVYIVDLSASIVLEYGELIAREMQQSIDALVPTQQFHIILSYQGRVEEFQPFGRTPSLVPALSKYKRAAERFLGHITDPPSPGPVRPVEAFERAFAVGPELIYFLSDGEFADAASDLLQQLKAWNARGNVAITTLGFVSRPGPNPSQFHPYLVLKRIADQHQGNFRVIGH